MLTTINHDLFSLPLTELGRILKKRNFNFFLSLFLPPISLSLFFRSLLYHTRAFQEIIHKNREPFFHALKEFFASPIFAGYIRNKAFPRRSPTGFFYLFRFFFLYAMSVKWKSGCCYFTAGKGWYHPQLELSYTCMVLQDS